MHRCLRHIPLRCRCDAGAGLRNLQTASQEGRQHRKTADASAFRLRSAASTICQYLAVGPAGIVHHRLSGGSPRLRILVPSGIADKYRTSGSLSLAARSRWFSRSWMADHRWADG
jgi:hypothetical protein